MAPSWARVSLVLVPSNPSSLQSLCLPLCLAFSLTRRFLVLLRLPIITQSTLRLRSVPPHLLPGSTDLPTTHLPSFIPLSYGELDIPAARRRRLNLQDQRRNVARIIRHIRITRSASCLDTGSTCGFNRGGGRLLISQDFATWMRTTLRST